MRLIFLFVFAAFFLSCSDPELHSMNQISKGAQLYRTHCANCHQEDGNGLGKLIPPLKNSDYLVQHAQQLPCLINNGINGELTVNGTMYNQAMPQALGLSKEEVLDIAIFVLQKFPANPISIRDSILLNQLNSCSK